jgi:hypothetical protein
MEPIYEVLKLVASAVLGGVVATFFTHFLVKSRERDRDSEARRRQFLAFLEQWHAEFVRIPHTDTNAIYAHYTMRVPSFYAEKRRCDGDFKPAVRFKELCAILGEMRHEYIVGGSKNPRDVIVEAIAALESFCDSKKA